MEKDISKEYYFSTPDHSEDNDQIEIFARPYVIAYISEIILIAVMFLSPVILFLILQITFKDAPHLFIENQTYLNIFILSASGFYLSLGFFALAEWINYYYDVLIVTRNLLIDIKQRTIFFREISQLHLANIEDVRSQIKGFFPTLFAYGNIIVQTAGALENRLIADIKNPQKISSKIIKLQEKARFRPPRTQKIENNVDKLFSIGEEKFNGNK